MVISLLKLRVYVVRAENRELQITYNYFHFFCLNLCSGKIGVSSLKTCWSEVELKKILRVS